MPWTPTGTPLGNLYPDHNKGGLAWPVDGPAWSRHPVTGARVTWDPAADGGLGDWVELAPATSWTHATRPSSPGTGRVGFNLDEGVLEYWNGTEWRQVLDDGATPLPVWGPGDLAGLFDVWDLDPARVQTTGGGPIADGLPAERIIGAENGLVFENPNPAQQPTWVAAGLRGRPGLVFDGIDDHLELAGVAVSGNYQAVWMLAQRNAYVGSGRAHLSCRLYPHGTDYTTPADCVVGWDAGGSTAIGEYRAGAGVGSSRPHPGTGVPYVVGSRWEAGGHIMRVDGVDAAPVAYVNAFGWDRLYLGARYESSVKYWASLTVSGFFVAMQELDGVELTQADAFYA